MEPAWSPDGTQIAFSSRVEGTFDIYTMSADGSGSRRLTSTKEHDSHPTWSSDGRMIAFARDGDIYVMDADGSGAHRISDSQSEESGAVLVARRRVDRVLETHPGHERAGVMAHAAGRQRAGTS